MLCLKVHRWSQGHCVHCPGEGAVHFLHIHSKEQQGQSSKNPKDGQEGVPV